ncbi:flavin reductase family protein [Butyrivibrio sp. VCD2006]|uniref:flavin reductase family protein n=1 Tax=Butyrivibrio sp. VCD2006 TaxID=1280664 RepID=UPI0003F62E71|nr:flavin reductase family protein [Butyrivibrio sp. VCD2006]
MAKEIWQPGNMLYPIPAVMVSCQREGEVPNIITVAWAGNICSSPAMLSISVRKERYSYDIIKETGEFVVNLTNRKLVKATDWCGVRSGRDFDKFKEMNLTPQKSNKISAPGILESPVNIECKVKQIVELGTHDLFIAEVMCVDVDDRYLDERNRFDLKKADLIAYSHGEYFSLGEKLGKFGYSVAKKKASDKKVKSAAKATKASKASRTQKQSGSKKAPTARKSTKTNKRRK